MNVSRRLNAKSKRISLDSPKVHHIPAWGDYEDPKRMDVIARIAEMRGRDPRIATLAVSILKKAGVQPRDYKGQAAALLHWVQHDLYYVNEPGERLQDPLYTLKVGYGDCDDLVIMLATLAESIRLPWKLVISGTKKGQKVRYHQGEKFPGGKKKGYDWSHIYIALGDRPFVPQKWYYAETTVRGAPLGWDVIEGDHSLFPELQPNYGATMYGFAANTDLNLSLPSTLVSDSPVVSRGMDHGGLRRLRQYGPPRGQVSTGQSYRADPVGSAKADMVAVVVMRADGKILALHRQNTLDFQPDKWDLPGSKTGGLPARAAAVKILKSEVGMKVKPERLERCSAIFHPAAGTAMFFLLRLKSGEAQKLSIQIASKEHQAWQWVDRSVLLRDFQTAPYVQMAFRACFRPSSLKTHTKKMVAQSATPVTDGTLTSALIFTDSVAQNLSTKFTGSMAPTFGGYGFIAEDSFLSNEYFGLPLWGIMLAGAGVYYYTKK